MTERGLWPVFSPEVRAEVARIQGPAKRRQERDLRALPWCSIDNDDSRDLDQLTVAEDAGGGATRVFVAVADVDALVADGSAIDDHARHNTTSVYTAAEIFPMLPEELSTDRTSLNPGQDRLAVVVGAVVGTDGSLEGEEVFLAAVHNHAQLAYDGVAAWLEDAGPLPEAAGGVPALEANLRLQDDAAQRLRRKRFEQGALDLETLEPKAVFEGDEVTRLRVEEKNRARQLIEDFMIAANGVVARFLESKRSPSLRRVVRTPKRWDRIVAVAAEHGDSLPVEPDSRALSQFLDRMRTADPLRFPDLSLTIVKLLGSGEYAVERPGQPPPGHFGLAVRDYGHSTAPNRRFPDLITHRLIKSALRGAPPAYGVDELAQLAAHCTLQEDNAEKVERHVRKSAAAMLLESRIGARFDSVVTGAGAKGTWVRILQPPVEGRLEQGFQGLDVGDRVRVQLIGVDVERGYIDFART